MFKRYLYCLLSSDSIRQCAEIIQRMERLLEDLLDESQRELHTFYKSMVREQNNLFTFFYLEEEDAQPNNNGSEWVVRDVKVNQKISGQFKVDKSAQNFAQL